MSIRPFFPEDFLVLCKHPIIRQLMVDRGHAPGQGFALSLRPWMRQAQATRASLPFLVPLELCGVPANAWVRRTAEVVLRGCGFVVQVAERMAQHFDMAGFKVWLKTAHPCKIPRRRLLFVQELVDIQSAPDALWYPVDIRMLAPPVRAEPGVDGAPPPPPPPPSGSPPSDEDSGGPGPARLGPTAGGRAPAPAPAQVDPPVRLAARVRGLEPASSPARRTHGGEEQCSLSSRAAVVTAAASVSQSKVGPRLLLTGFESSPVAPSSCGSN